MRWHLDGRQKRAETLMSSKLVFVLIMLIGAGIGWRIAPDVEEYVLPVFQDIKVVPFDDAHPEKVAELQLDRVCWKYSYRKARDGTPLWRAVTIVAPNGDRFFSMPIDARTGETFNTRNSHPAGWSGITRYCAVMPDNFDATGGFQIENFGEFKLPYHIWLLNQVFPTVTVPPMGGP